MGVYLVGSGPDWLCEVVGGAAMRLADYMIFCLPGYAVIGYMIN